LSANPVAAASRAPIVQERAPDFVARSQCPACRSKAFRQVFSCAYESPLVDGYLSRHYDGLAQLERLRGETFTVCRCDRCTLLFQPLAPAGALIQELYDGWIPALSPRQIYVGDDLQSSRYRIDQVDFLLQTTGLDPVSIRFLDFGCGWSEWLSVARAFGCDVAGAELSNDRKQHAATLGIPMLDWQDIGRRRFDVINLEQVLEHLVDPIEVLTHLRQSLEKDGILRVAVPDGRKMASRLSGLESSMSVEPGYLMPIQPLEHLNCFSHASLAAIGESAGLRLVRPSLRKLFDSVSGWCSLKGAARNLMRPVYRHVYPKSTIAFFART